MTAARRGPRPARLGRVVIVGRGRVGRALHAALDAARVRVTLVAGRAAATSARVADADVVVLAVPDAAIAGLAARLEVAPGTVVLHTAGQHTEEVLDSARARGAEVGVFHPAASVVRGLAAPVFVVRGEAPAVRAARSLAAALDAHVVHTRVPRASYHALCALLANGAVGLAHASVEGLRELGIAPRDARAIAASLLRSVAHNVDAMDVPAALTGPIQRGDRAAVARHRSALAALDARTLAAYDAVAPLVLACALDAGLSARDARAIAALIATTGARRRRPRARARR